MIAVLELGQLRSGPFTVRCAKRSVRPSTHASLRDALCYAQNQADFYDTECLVTDPLGQSFAVRRGSGRCPDRKRLDPFDPRVTPRFHPHPAHPRSRGRYMIFTPPYVPPTQQRPSPTPDDFT